MLHKSFLGFKTPIGTFVICGLHGLPVWLYGLKTHLWSPFMSHHAQLGVTGVLVSGRALCMAVEVSLGLINVFSQHHNYVLIIQAFHFSF